MLRKPDTGVGFREVRVLVPDELREQASRLPDRVAVRVDGGEAMTFAEWEARSNAVARGLIEAGVAPGVRVVLLVENAAALIFYVAYFAAHKAGAVAVPVNPRYAPREIEHILGNCEAEVVVASEGQVHRVRELRDRFPSLRWVVAPGARGGGELDWDDLVAGDPAPVQAAIGDDALADILYTSGTTGLPKGVASTHANVTAYRVPPADRGGVFLHSIPLATFFGTHGAQLLALRLALTNLLVPEFDTTRFASLIATERPKWLVMVPTHILLLRSSGALEGVDTSSVRAVLFGSAPTPTAAIEWLAATFPRALLMNGYGLTEAGGSACMCVLTREDVASRAGSVGRPVPGAEVRVVADDGTPLPPGEVGEVCLRVAGGERSYYRDPKRTAATWRGGWVYTGDLGYLDDEGYLYIVDRKKDMIVRGGYNVYSVEVESALHEHPRVVEAAVVGVPHDILGQDVAAVVRLEEGASLTLEEVREFLRPRLADYKIPRRLELRTRPLPRSGMGKVDKRRLLAELTEATGPEGRATGTGDPTRHVEGGPR